MVIMTNMSNNSNWRDDDLERGLAADLFNLSGLGVEESQIGAYNMTEVLNLVKEPSMLNDMSVNDASNPDVKVEGSPLKQFKEDPATLSFILKAPTSPSKKMDEANITYLNQGQSYQVRLQSLWDTSFLNNSIVNGIVKVGFFERKLKVLEAEKYEEWLSNRPAERLLEIDVPMSVGIHNIRSQGTYTNEIEFEWDTNVEALVYVKINCVSSEFTKGKSGGESGVPLKLQIDITNTKSPSLVPLYSAGCQIKVFRIGHLIVPKSESDKEFVYTAKANCFGAIVFLQNKPKGADRKHKIEMSKYEQLSKEEMEQCELPSDFTVLIENLAESSDERLWSSPTSSFQNCSLNSTISSPSTFYSPVSSVPPPPPPERVTQDSTIEESRAWLAHNRFHVILPQLNNYTGADILRLSKKDIILIAGNAEGIRLHNLIKTRAAEPLLTMYVCVESMQDSTTMKEYQVVYLETLTLQELTEKLAKKCNMQSSQVSAIFRQGPTGICILVNDEMVRNFSDELSFIVDVVRDEQTSLWRILLK